MAKTMLEEFQEDVDAARKHSPQMSISSFENWANIVASFAIVVRRKVGRASPLYMCLVGLYGTLWRTVCQMKIDQLLRDAENSGE